MKQGNKILCFLMEINYKNNTLIGAGNGANLLI